MTETDSRSELAAKPAARLAPAAEALATVSRTRALPRDARASGAEGTLPGDEGVRDHGPARRLRCLANDRRTGANDRSGDRLHDKT